MFSNRLHKEFPQGPASVFWHTAYQEIPTAALPGKTFVSPQIGLSGSRYENVPDVRPLAAN
jgi:hypothetical protein